MIVCSHVAFAQPNLQLGSATGAPGETVTIPVTFTNNGSVVGFQFDVQFNSGQLTPGSLADGPTLSPHFQHSNTVSAGTLRVIVRPEVSASLPSINTGVVVNIPFTINAGATPGTYDLTLPSAGVLSGVGTGAYFSDKSANAVSAGTLVKGQITVGTPDISVSPMALDFGTIKVGTTSTQKPVTIGNSGTANLTITKVEINGTNASDFSQSNNCSNPITPGNSCVANVTFTPSSTGPKAATLKIEFDDPDQGVINVALSGTGEIPQVLVRRVLLSEGFSPGIPPTWTSEDAWGTGCGRAIGSPFVTPWAIVDPSCGTVSDELLYTPMLDATACTKLALLFSNRFSHGTGTTGNISVTDDYGKTWVDVETLTTDEGPAWKEIGLDGLARTEGAQIEFAYLTSGGFWAIDNVQVLCEPANLTFKSLKRPSFQVQTLVIANAGTVDLNVTSFALSGDDASQFSVEDEDCTGKAVAPSGHCTVQVAFSPETKGIMDGTALSILSDGAPSPLNIPLDGRGVDLLVTQNEGTLGSQVKIHGAEFGVKKG